MSQTGRLLSRATCQPKPDHYVVSHYVIFQLFGNTQHPRGLMEQHTNTLIVSYLNLYTLVWLGCKLPSGRATCHPTAAPREADKTHKSAFLTRAKPADTYRNPAFSTHLTKMLLMSHATHQTHFLLPNRGGSRVAHNPKTTQLWRSFCRPQAAQQAKQPALGTCWLSHEARPLRCL